MIREMYTIRACGHVKRNGKVNGWTVIAMGVSAFSACPVLPTATGHCQFSGTTDFGARVPRGHITSWHWQAWWPLDSNAPTTMYSSVLIRNSPVNQENMAWSLIIFNPMILPLNDWRHRQCTGSGTNSSMYLLKILITSIDQYYIDQ